MRTASRAVDEGHEGAHKPGAAAHHQDPKDAGGTQAGQEREECEQPLAQGVHGVRARAQQGAHWRGLVRACVPMRASVCERVCAYVRVCL